MSGTLGLSRGDRGTADSRRNCYVNGNVKSLSRMTTDLERRNGTDQRQRRKALWKPIRVKVTVIYLIDRSLGFAVAGPRRSCSGRIHEVSPFKIQGHPWQRLLTLPFLRPSAVPQGHYPKHKPSTLAARLMSMVFRRHVRAAEGDRPPIEHLWLLALNEQVALSHSKI